MSVRGPLAAGTVLSAAVVSAWSYIASLAIGPAGPLHLGRNLLSGLRAAGLRAHRERR